MQDQGDFIAYPVSATLWVRKGAKDKVLSDTVTVLDNDDHVFKDFIVEGLTGYVVKFNERKRTATVRKDAPKPEERLPMLEKATKVSSIDKAFAEMGGSGDFTLDVESPAEAKFRAMCDKHGYSTVELANGSTLADRIKELIQANGTSTDTYKRMNAKLKSFGQQTLSAADWKVAVAASVK